MRKREVKRPETLSSNLVLIKGNLTNFNEKLTRLTILPRYPIIHHLQMFYDLIQKVEVTYHLSVPLELCLCLLESTGGTFTRRHKE